MQKTTWIAIGCVAVAVAASQIYGAVRTKEPAAESVLSEVKSPVTPGPLPTVKSLISEEAAATSEPAEAPVVAPQKTPLPTEAPRTFLLPASGEVIKGYSASELVYFAPLKEWRCHLGMDFATSDSDKVLAVTDGKVTRVYTDHLYGITVVIDHGNGLQSSYASLSDVVVEEGTEVTGGTLLGHMGETAVAEEGVHLHFSMEQDGKPIDPMQQNG